ncbi:Sin3 binding region of histone deacetylase complex subunit SAP30-domain-containing protein [Phascolomyces articulosus]|uniref:Sin3 binding region of histone deacetylase complex subunit SAP30-domain-containing protein n=1 Tax=Phascolomyces articulosus TaxID=60185 RepID=A0AAD5KAZ9_9FUNG|nr:Sin3 binding region of histone deacetylase complex subunit SAP30-domain-containing protein [Phascolomyces articulosus]
MKAKPRANAVNGNNTSNTSSSSLKHVDRERDKRRRTTENNNVGKEFQTINFNSLDMGVLRKYARVHKIKVGPTCNKEELVAAVSRHFANQTVKEVDAITCFLYTARYRACFDYL